MALVFGDTLHLKFRDVWTATGAFTITGEAQYRSFTALILGLEGSGSGFLTMKVGGKLSLAFGGSPDLVSTGLAENEWFTYTIERDASNLLTVTWVTPQGTFTNSVTAAGNFSLDLIGGYNNIPANNTYKKTMRGVLSMVADGLPTRTYDFETSTGTVLTDTTSALNADFVNQGAGGFEAGNGASNAVPTVTMPADQTNIAAGATVTLVASDADSDGTVASRVWTQTAGDTVTLSGDTSNTLSFTAPSTGSPQTLTFQYVVTDNEGATSTPATVDVGVLAAAGNDPTITLVQPTAANSCRQWDESGNATFPIEIAIGNRPAGALIEVSQDGGSTWSNLNSSPVDTVNENLVVNGQKTVTFRLSTDIGVTQSILLTAGFTILAWGQSNELGQGNVGANSGVTFTSGAIPQMFKNGVFTELVDGTQFQTTGTKTSTWPRIAQLYSEQGIPIILANVAVGSTSVNDWLKSTGTLYPNITSGGTALNGVSMCTCLIGETDARSSRTLSDMITKYGQMVDDVFTDFGCPTYITEFPFKNDNGGSQKIIDAFADVIANNANAFNGGNLQQMDISEPATTDGLHLQTFEQLTLAAELRYAAFNALNVDLSISGIPDGSQYLFLIDLATKRIAYDGNATFASGVATIPLPVESGVTLKGWVDDGTGSTPVGTRVLKVV